MHIDVQIADIRRWFEFGVEKGYEFLIIFCDTFDYTDYPKFCSEEDFEKTHQCESMQKIMEVYNLRMDMESQLKEYRAFNYPESYTGPKVSIQSQIEDLSKIIDKGIKIVKEVIICI